VVLTVIVRLDDTVFVAVTEPQQSGLFDRGPQQMVEIRNRNRKAPADQFARSGPDVFL
jgi:hypothetical protein